MILSRLIPALGLALAIGAAPAGPSLRVEPQTGLADAPLGVRAAGLVPGSTAEVVATARSGDALWMSVATCRADGGGQIVLATCDSSAGTYTGIDPGGLVWSMLPQPPGKKPFALAAGKPIDYTIELRVAGSVVATAHALRARVLAGVALRPIVAPFRGTLALPPSAGKHPAVILLGGSEGGDAMTDVAQLLASHGYVAATVAYFGLPGLPQQLVDIPVEDVGTALTWLSQRSDVDANRIGVFGISKGGEFALLAASTYPRIRAAVSVVGVPFAMYGVNPNGPAPNAGSWSRNGVELPFVPPDAAAGARLHELIVAGGKVSLGILADASIEKNPVAVQRAFFPLERIAGPILCIGAGDDHLKNSARDCDIAFAYLSQHKHAFSDRKLNFPSAGHDVLTFYLPTLGYDEFTLSRFTEIDGGSAESDGRANEIAWPAILRFLETALATKA